MPAAGPDTTILSWFNGQLAKHSDLWLPISVVGLVALLVLRVPAPLLDGLLVVNLTATVLVLLATLYVPTATALSTMPTIILLTTLFRLALNVSSTRLILLEGEAGQVISAFGSFVVGGNYAVGAVVFLVIVMIQLLVVAKGGDRVAEISARFVLDAVPGKQMAIDNDLAGHSITPEDAKRRRRELAREAQLYGAMDGALKFVKGDAVAGIVIAAINILAGFAIGVLQGGLDLRDAAAKYSLLTIGDGLVSQIPSILTCLSAAILVTRVSDPEEGSRVQLGGQIGTQLLREPRSLAITGAVMLLLAVVGILTDSFPWLPFTGVGVGTAGTAFWVARRSKPASAAAPAPLAALPGASLSGNTLSSTGDPGPASFQPKPLVLVLEPGLANLYGHDQERFAQLRKDVTEAWTLTQARYGVPLAPMPIIYQRGLGGHGYQIRAHGGLIGSGQMAPATAFVRATKEALLEKQLTALMNRRLPGTRVEYPEIAATDSDAARAAGFTVISATSALGIHVAIVLQEHLGHFVTVEATQRLLDGLAKEMQTLVQAICPTIYKTHEIAELLRLLAEEQVPILDLRAILESMLRWANLAGRDFMKLLELVRQDLRHAICMSFSVAGSELRHYGLAPRFEEQLLAMPVAQQWSREQRSELMQAIHATLRHGEHAFQPPVILVPAEVRRTLFELVREALSEVRIMAFEEVTQDTVPLLIGVVHGAARRESAGARAG